MLDRITDIQSYSTVIRDVLFAKCCSLPFFEGFTARRCKQLPTQPYHLPYLGVYIMDEPFQSDGDWNAGHFAWIHELKLGFSVQMEHNDPVELELMLDRAYWAIMNGIWRDQYICNLFDTWNPHTHSGNPDNTRFEGVKRGIRRHNWGPARQNNETPWAELQYEPILSYRTEWEPIVDDWLESIHVETVPMRHQPLPRVPPAEEVQRIISKYEFKTGG